MPTNQISATTFPQQDATESLVAEPLCVRIALDRHVMAAVTHAGVSADNSHVPLPPETARVVQALKLICEEKRERTFTIYGVTLKLRPLNKGKGTQHLFGANCVCGVEIVAAPVGRDRQHIRVEFYVMRNVWNQNEPAFYLECVGNPTSIMTGNNLRPVTTRDAKTRQKEPYPSSSPRVLSLVNRSLFHFLEAVAPGSGVLFSAETQAAIANGDFRVSHIQWACYAATPAAPFLKILKTMFGTLSETEEDVSPLAECMGFEFSAKSNKRTSRPTSILLIKRQGGDIAWSVDFYDKRARVSQTKQGGTLDSDDGTLIDTHVRIDVTAQYRAILQIIGAARSFLKKHRALFSQLPDAEFAEVFLALEVKPTLRQLEFAVFVLSHREVGGRLVRGSFAGWLIPMILGKVIPLRRVVAFTAAGLRAMKRSDEPVAVAWRAAKWLDNRDWVRTLSFATKFKKTKIYNDREKFWHLNQIDIAIPYAFYHRFQIHPAITLMSAEDRETLVKARDHGDGKAIIRVLDAADAKFFTQMKTLVAEPILKPPALLPTKVLGEVELVLGKPAKAIEQGEGVVETLTVPFRRTWPRQYRPSWIAEGIDGRSSFFAIEKVLNETRRQLAGSSSDAERKRLGKRLNWIVRQRRKKHEAIEQAKRTRQLKKRERPQRNRFPVPLNKPQPTNEG